jgi:hypothetical protein
LLKVELNTIKIKSTNFTNMSKILSLLYIFNGDIHYVVVMWMMISFVLCCRVRSGDYLLGMSLEGHALYWNLYTKHLDAENQKLDQQSSTSYIIYISDHFYL